MNKNLAILLLSLIAFAATWTIMHVPFGRLGCGASNILAPDAHALEVAAHNSNIADDEKIELAEERAKDDPDGSTIEKLQEAISKARDEDRKENAADFAADEVEARNDGISGRGTVTSSYRWILRFQGIFALVNVLAVFGMFFSGMRIVQSPEFSQRLHLVAAAILIFVTSIVMLNQPAGFIMSPISTGTGVISSSIFSRLGELTGSGGFEAPKIEAAAMGPRDVCDAIVDAARDNANDCSAMEAEFQSISRRNAGIMNSASPEDNTYCDERVGGSFDSIGPCLESNPGIMDAFKALGK